MGNGYTEAGVFAKLPESILLQIFSLLEPKTLVRMSAVCRQWNRVTKDEHIWKRKFINNFKLDHATAQLRQLRRPTPVFLETDENCMEAEEMDTRLTIDTTINNSWLSEYRLLENDCPRYLSQTIQNVHTDEVLHVAFAHDGTMFATSSKDCTIKVWWCSQPAVGEEDRGRDVTLMMDSDLKKLFRWKYTQFSQFNEDDTLLLVSGALVGNTNTKGEIIIFEVDSQSHIPQLNFRARVQNSPYDVFGCWYDRGHVLNGELFWLGDLNSQSQIWLCKASQDTHTERTSVLVPLFKFLNRNAANLRMISVAERVDARMRAAILTARRARRSERDRRTSDRARKETETGVKTTLRDRLQDLGYEDAVHRGGKDDGDRFSPPNPSEILEGMTTAAAAAAAAEEGAGGEKEILEQSNNAAADAAACSSSSQMKTPGDSVSSSATKSNNCDNCRLNHPTAQSLGPTGKMATSGVTVSSKFIGMISTGIGRNAAGQDVTGICDCTCHGAVTDRLLIFSTGNKTYTPHQIGLKLINGEDVAKRMNAEVMPKERMDRIQELMRRDSERAKNGGQPNGEDDEADLQVLDSDPDEDSEDEEEEEDAVDGWDAIEQNFDHPDQVIEMNGHVIGIALSADCRYLYVNVRAWVDIGSDEEVDVWRPPKISEEIEIRVIDLHTFKANPSMTYRAHKGFTPNEECFFIFLDSAEHFIASGSEDSLGYLWSRHYGSFLSTLDHSAVVNSVAFNPKDPQMLVTVSDDQTIKIWRSKRQMKLMKSQAVFEGRDFPTETSAADYSEPLTRWDMK